MVKQGTPVETVMAAIFGVVMAGSFVEMGVSRILPFVKRLITPLVTGIVVLLIGLTLIKVGLISMGGGFGAMAKGTFASAENLTLSGLVLGTIILLNRVPIVWVRSTALVIALVIGYLAAAFLGRLDFTGMHPRCSRSRRRCTSASASWALFVPMLIIYLVTSLEAIGDVTATSKISNEPVEGPVWMQRIKGGVLVNGANSLLAGVFNTFPAGVRAEQRRDPDHRRRQPLRRHLDRGMLVVLGLFPVVAGVLQAVPGRARRRGDGDVRRGGRIGHQHPRGRSSRSSRTADHRGVARARPRRVASAGHPQQPAARAEERAGIGRGNGRHLRARDELVPAGKVTARRLTGAPQAALPVHRDTRLFHGGRVCPASRDNVARFEAKGGHRALHAIVPPLGADDRAPAGHGFESAKRSGGLTGDATVTIDRQTTSDPLCRSIRDG